MGVNGTIIVAVLTKIKTNETGILLHISMNKKVSDWNVITVKYAVKP